MISLFKKNIKRIISIDNYDYESIMFFKMYEFFRSNGYKLTIEIRNQSRSLENDGSGQYALLAYTPRTLLNTLFPQRSIKILFSSEAQGFPEHLENKLCIDNLKCFDKPSKCPIKGLRFPKDKYEETELLNDIDFLKSQRGFDLSNGYSLNTKSQYGKDLEKWNL